MLPLSALVTEWNYSGAARHGTRSHAPRGATAPSDMAVFLAKHRAMLAHSPLAAYIDLLPRQDNDRPIHWEPQLLQTHLRGSHFPAFVLEKAAHVRADYAALGDSGVSFADYRWGRDVVTTRAIADSTLAFVAVAKSVSAAAASSSTRD